MNDLSNNGTSDFQIAFTLVTTQTDDSIAVYAQRGACDASLFWDMRIQQNQIVIETDSIDGTGAALDAYIQGATTVNDGKSHAIRITQTAQVLSLYVDNHLDGQTTTTASFGALAALATGTDACVGVDGTVAFDTNKGSVSGLCITAAGCTGSPSDVNNCGACGTVCSSGHLCVESACSASCGVGGTPGTCPTGTSSTPAMCPSACTGGCVQDLCVISCNGTSACQGETIDCPNGMRCDVQCGGLSACQVTTINCPADSDCTVECSDLSTCQLVAIQCPATAGCSVVCSGDSACGGSTLQCGQGACDSTCNGPETSLDSVDCGSSCGCTSSCVPGGC